jgi:hypothetical protein
VTKPIERDAIYRSPEIIETCVRWYLTYRLSYRDLVALMSDQGVRASHTSIMRWVLRFVPEYERRWNRRARRVNSSWRVDESVPQWSCLGYADLRIDGSTPSGIVFRESTQRTCRAGNVTHSECWTIPSGIRSGEKHRYRPAAYSLKRHNAEGLCSVQ